MKKELLKQIKYAARKLELKHFFRPDGSACPPFANRNESPRLLIILSGEKHELMGFNGKAERIILQPGDFYFMDSQVWEECNFSTVHDFLCILPRKTMLRTVWYTIREPNLKRWPDNIAVQTAQVPENILNAYDILRSDEAERYPAVASAAAKMILELAMVEVENGVPPEENCQKLYEAMREFLVENFSRGISRADLAAHFRKSPSYISALFKQYGGKSFGQVSDELRIHHAKKLLRKTGMPIKVIAEKCGYGNYVYFVRRFRELTGIAPGHYRTSGTTVAALLPPEKVETEKCGLRKLCLKKFSADCNNDQKFEKL